MRIEGNKYFLEVTSMCEKMQQNQQKSSRKPKRWLSEKDEGLERALVGQQVDWKAGTQQTVLYI